MPLLFALACVAAGIYINIAKPPAAASYYGHELCVQGRVVGGSAKQTAYGHSFLLDSMAVTAVDGAHCMPQHLSGRVRVNVSAAQDDLYLQGRVSLRGCLQAQHGLSNPGGFDSELWQKMQGIVGKMKVKGAQLTVVNDSDRLDWFLGLSNKLRTKILRSAPDEAGALLCAMALSGYEGIGESTRESFSITGLAHILSVSGAHMSLLGAVMLFVLGSDKSRAKSAVAVLVLLLYALLCSAAAAVWRSFLMSAIVFLGASPLRRAQSGNIFCLVGIILLLYEPYWLLDPGFQLSFAATGGLVYILPGLRPRLARCLPAHLADALAVTLAAQLASLPFLLWHFHQLSLVTFVANVLLVPPLEALVIVTLGGALLPGYLGAMVLSAAAALMRLLMLGITFLAKVPLAAVNVAHIGLGAWLLYYFLLVLWLCPFGTLFSGRQKKYCTLCVCAALLFLFLRPLCLPRPFTVHFMDVGQGDAALVLTPDGHSILVDCGASSGDYDLGSRVVVPYLRYLGVNKIDLLALSHGHNDHAGGAAAVAARIPVKQILLAPEPHSEDVQRLLKAARGAKISYAQGGQSMRFGEITAEVLSANCGSEAETNESSVIMQIAGPQGSVLFTGDIDEDTELKSARYLKQATVLKAAHHGSRYSSSQAFLQKVRPAVTIISVGADNRYGHPGAETLARLAASGSKICRTDVSGALKIVFDSEGAQCYSYRYQKNKF